MNPISHVIKFIKHYARLLDDLTWANVFHDTVSGYDWYNVKSISLGRFAVGYNYAYVLSRILNEKKPMSILECGLGQSTKIINSYIEYYKDNNMVFDVVEGDSDWIDFFSSTYEIPSETRIHYRRIKEKLEKRGKYRYFEDFQTVVFGKKYNLICVDAESGVGAKL